ncbi:ATP-dependent zinc metalloprotease FtsH [Candidatus Uabimicrobium amorphum]|uniref:ATP-dependent zinc metalloprotease FtsH n=1 Tax=Uabimicrobium amorphum TaxID=2596890 RepID=A0A5S9IMC7_UABAM|nr:ATP-dependent zinc metalloprotease FtsH [Candidatus Uabimicrobium amorphum]BBM84529.1 ATP-dependent zinc metalloprotease FtsH [Candidatus Uabimicrobium amorphum]
MKRQEKYTIWHYLALFSLLLLLQSTLFSSRATKEISYKEFRDYLAAGRMESVVLSTNSIVGKLKDSPKEQKTDLTQPSTQSDSKTNRMKDKSQKIEKKVVRYFRVVRLEDKKLIEDLQAAKVDYRGRIESNFLSNFFFNWVLPIGFMILIWTFIFRRFSATQNQFLNLGKNKAKIQAENLKSQITFKEVAGIDEAVEEVQEIVDFLKNPDKYTRLGGKLPKGILLVGPPGTGKTLLAKAVAGEAEVPFFNISGSDFIEMFVGVGAARVRDLFKEAKQKSPCIIFIDEIDAIGKSRSRHSVSGGYDERENTLNQLLVEMDGFQSGSNVIIMGATNRPDLLDKALLRPGRFDRQVLVDKPDLNGRIDIFKVHCHNIVLADDVDFHNLAAQTPGFAGADIANVANEAALLASRKNKDQVSKQDFENAIERVVAGLEKKSKLINAKERKIVAYHESGHAIVGYFTPGADEVQKVSIVPRGFGALGYTLQMPLEDRYLMGKEELLGKIKGLLGGRAAEEIIFSDISTGASNDLERVAQIARNMITVYGMSQNLPNFSLVNKGTPGFLGQDNLMYKCSEKIEQIVDEEVLEMIQHCYEDAKNILIEKKPLLEEMANALLQKEVLEKNEIEEILGKENKS